DRTHRRARLLLLSSGGAIAPGPARWPRPACGSQPVGTTGPGTWRVLRNPEARHPVERGSLRAQRRSGERPALLVAALQAAHPERQHDEQDTEEQRIAGNDPDQRQGARTWLDGNENAKHHRE